MMSRNPLLPHREGFRFTPELGQRLRELRNKAGLKQEDIAARMGRAGPGAKTAISRLERGKSAHPTFDLVVEYLTACGASLSDIEDLAPSAPSASPKKKRVRKPKSREERLRLVRKRAETLPTELVIEDRLFEWLNDEDMLPSVDQRKALAGYGRTVFYTLLKARKATHAARRKLLATGLTSGEDADGVRGLIERLFEEMDKSGVLDRKEPVDAAAVVDGRTKLKKVKKAEKRMDEHYETRFRLWHDMRHWVIERIRNESRSLHPELGVTQDRILGYLNVVSEFCIIADETEPGSEERRQRFEQRVEKATDKAGCRKVGEFSIRRYDELKPSIPKKPEGK